MKHRYAWVVVITVFAVCVACGIGVKLYLLSFPQPEERLFAENVLFLSYAIMEFEQQTGRFPTSLDELGKHFDSANLPFVQLTGSRTALRYTTYTRNGVAEFSIFSASSDSPLTWGVAGAEVRCSSEIEAILESRLLF